MRKTKTNWDQIVKIDSGALVFDATAMERHADEIDRFSKLLTEDMLQPLYKPTVTTLNPGGNLILDPLKLPSPVISSEPLLETNQLSAIAPTSLLENTPQSISPDSSIASGQSNGELPTSLAHVHRNRTRIFHSPEPTVTIEIDCDTMTLKKGTYWLCHVIAVYGFDPTFDLAGMWDAFNSQPLTKTAFFRRLSTPPTRYKHTFQAAAHQGAKVGDLAHMGDDGSIEPAGTSKPVGVITQVTHGHHHPTTQIEIT